MQKKFQNQKVSETPKGSSTLRESFGTGSQKQSKENHDKRPHPPIFSRKIIATRSFMKNWKFPLSNASAPWDKKHRQDREVQKNFRNQKVSETPKGSSTLREKFGTVSQKQSKENHDKRPHAPIFSRKIIATRSFMKNWKFPPSNASAPWDKKHRQDREVQKKFRNQKVSETPKGSSTIRESFGTVSQKTIKGKSW